ncbi:beta-carotene hydroxylase [Thermogymnomonas acidicola]|uniref:Beta-carotene hydroxylase n=1 Tax=Thermogymnomonas acidicola TaxID=399579 RepID=A0AA37BRM2_9ARCH|nr:porin [Thermogymnomonas acidicola]GGM75267.1 beta-carotene hydroxylase [Thermogymnomonas acidicola]
MIINYFVDVPASLAGFLGMEAIARLMHKYVMHGILWPLHMDHHIEMGHRFQRNNFFALFFAAIAVSLFVLTLRTGNAAFASVGFGMAMYGLAYLIVHDMIIHNYYLHLRNRRHSRYVQNLIAVHELHHVNDGRNRGRNWGFLFYIPGIDEVPWKKGDGQK